MAGVVDDDARNERAMGEIFIVSKDGCSGKRERETFQWVQPSDDRERVVVCIV